MGRRQPDQRIIEPHLQALGELYASQEAAAVDLVRDPDDAVDHASLADGHVAKLGVTSERGANMVEYVLILTLIALVVILVVTALGNRVSNRFSSASSALT